MKVKVFLYLLAGGLFSTSCSEDFLQRDPLGQENSGSFFKSELGCEQGVLSIYDPLQWKSMYSVNYWAIGDVCSDDADKGGQSENDQPSMQELETFNVNPSNTYLTDMWTGFYVGIGRANLMLYQTASSSDVNFSNELRLSYRAEAKFLRALYYFDLLKIFGAVPLVETPIKPGEGADIGNRQAGDFDGSLQKQAILDFIISELEEIQDVTIQKQEKGRVTHRAILSLLAKAYIWNKSWDKALETSEKVISISQSLSNVKYQDIFSLDNESNSEIVFAIQFVDGDDYDRLAEGSERSTYQNVRLIKPVDISESTYFLGERGYGFNIPRKELVDLFDPQDPRLDMILSRGDSLWFDFSYIDQKKYPKATLRKHPILFSSDHTGYYSRKAVLEYNEYGTKLQSSGLDYPLIRLADVYLFASEAAFELKQNDKALKYVNDVRERARLSARKEVGFKKYVSVESSSPAPLSSVSREDIYNERRMELFCEGHRFFDLVRTGLASEKISALSKDCFGMPINFQKGKNEVFPIPQNEIIKHSGGKLIQNPNY